MSFWVAEALVLRAQRFLPLSCFGDTAAAAVGAGDTQKKKKDGEEQRQGVPAVGFGGYHGASRVGFGGSSIAAMEAGSGAHIKLSGRGQLLPGTDRRVIFLSGPFRAIMDATELARLVSGARVTGVRASPLHTPRRARCRGYSVAGHP